MSTIAVPVDWRPRHYQMPLWSFLEAGGKRAVAVWHRRAGKDATALNWTVTSAFKRPGLYWHLLPTYNQGRKIVWDGRTKEGRPFLDAWPKDAIRAVNNTDMKIELENDSIWQVVGTDNVDRLVGANPVGCVFSEYSLQDPQAWDYIRPILAENGGWALFIYTPRGRNHGHDIFEMARGNQKWFCQVLSVDDTKVLSPEIIEEERAAGMPEEMVQQEFFCSFDAGLVGSYYGTQMARALEDGRIMTVPWEPRVEVHTAWDLGMHDACSIWFYQQVGLEVRLIDYYEGSGEGLAHYARVLKDKEYVYGKHYAPHDIEVRELGTGKSRKDTAAMLGIRFTTLPKLPLDDGIDAVRNILPRCYFDYEKCTRGIEALRQYKKKWNDKMRCYSSTPDHDWSSHAADSFRYLAVALKEKKRTTIAMPQYADNVYNPFG
jgi:phage terminase large subunit